MKLRRHLRLKLAVNLAVDLTVDFFLKTSPNKSEKIPRKMIILKTTTQNLDVFYFSENNLSKLF